MRNPRFSLLTTSLQNFKKLNFTITEKAQSSTEDKYYLVTSESKDTPLIQMKTQNDKAQDYKVLEAHITVFEYIKKEDNDSQAAYHLTVKVSGKEDKRNLTLRSYFNLSGGFLYINCKNEKDEVIELQRNSTDLASLLTSIAPFNKTIQDIYNAKNQAASKKYKVLVNLATSKSEILANKIITENKAKVEEYIQYLGLLINHMEEWHQFQLNPNIHLLEHFRRLKTLVEKDVLAHVKLAEKKESSNDIVKVVEVSSQTVTSATTEMTKNPPNKVFSEEKSLAIPSAFKTEASIIEQHEILTKEISGIQSSYDLTKKINKLNQLSETAYEQFAKLLTKFTKIPDAVVTGLLKIISIVLPDDFVNAIKFKHDFALKMMLEHSTYYGDSQALIEEAYTNNAKAFEFLVVTAKLNYCYRNNEGRTLLMRACLEKRENIMLCLLKAGASQYDRDSRGFTALGYLTTNHYEKPNLKLVKLFLDNCAEVKIDLLQGSLTTSLAYACQKRWNEAVKLYISYGANPCALRGSDGLSSLSICAGKGYDDTLKILLTSTHSLSVEMPIAVANQYKKSNCVKLLSDFAKDKKTDKVEEIGLRIPKGTNTDEVFSYLNGDNLLLFSSNSSSSSSSSSSSNSSSSSSRSSSRR